MLTYHGVMPQGYEPIDAGFDGNLVSVEMLRRQLRLLKKHYCVISPEDLLAWRHDGSKLPQRAVLITCDDGLLNCLTDMLPVLQEEGIRCLFSVTGASAEMARTTLWYEDLFLYFLRASSGAFEISAEGITIQGELGAREQRRAIWWKVVKQLSQVAAQRRFSFLQVLGSEFGVDLTSRLEDEQSPSCRRFGLMTSSELQKLASAGMSIGAHTMSHPMLSQMPAELAYAEIADCKMKLEDILGQPVWAFVYPFGDPQSVTPRVLAMPQWAGFEAAFMNLGGGFGSETPAYALPRIHVTTPMRLSELEAHVSGFYSFLRENAAALRQRIAYISTLPRRIGRRAETPVRANPQTYEAPSVELILRARLSDTFRAAAV